MLSLSRDFLEDLADKLLKEYYSGQMNPTCSTDIDSFAKNFMHLQVRYEDLHFQETDVLGVTAYQETNVVLNPKEPDRKIYINANVVLLDYSLDNPRMIGRRNFTLAHECSHHAIYLLEPYVTKASCRKCGSTYSLRDLKTANDWSEWQANTLGAALLMPRRLIDYLFFLFHAEDKIKIYEGDYMYHDSRNKLDSMARYLGVSRSALLIRLKQLDRIEIHSFQEYLDDYEMESIREAVYYGKIPHR
jgi:Zn-dependent peptidase ImmA (M78 family)